MSSGRYWIFIADRNEFNMANTTSGDLMNDDGNHEDVSVTVEATGNETIEFDAYKSFPRKVSMPKEITLTDTDNHKLDLIKFWGIDLTETSGPT